jgi:hypothetical protein
MTPYFAWIVDFVGRHPHYALTAIFLLAHVILAAALAQLGRLDEARAAVQAALARCPYNVGWTSNYGSIAASR